MNNSVAIIQPVYLKIYVFTERIQFTGFLIDVHVCDINVMK